ncbi:hypothetical protein SLA2020_110150 [Shorea laevis]
MLQVEVFAIYNTKINKERLDCDLICCDMDFLWLVRNEIIFIFQNKETQEHKIVGIDSNPIFPLGKKQDGNGGYLVNGMEDISLTEWSNNPVLC